MYRYIILCISMIASLMAHETYAVSIYRPGLVEIEAAARPCLPWGSGIPINDTYTCPLWESSLGNSLPLTQERITCSIQIALSLVKIDAEADIWTQGLQKQRNPDAEVWFKEIRNKTTGWDTSFEKKYQEVCSLTGWTISEDGKWLGCAKTLDFFPETACKRIVASRVTALQNMGYILASQGIAKSYQNDKDTTLDKVKTAYDTLLWKWSEYVRMISNAVSKFTAYIKNAVK